MTRHAPLKLPPTRADLAVARASVRAATPATESGLRIATWLADEKLVAGAAALFWLYARLGQDDRALAREADHMLGCVAVAAVLQHGLKHVVARERPNRTVARSRHRRIPRAGKAWDSFPSGHAIHMGAIAGPLARLAPRPLRPLVWPVLAALASTRVLLLAHYPSDVAAGFGIGAAIGRLVRLLQGRR
jgi:membrane-associated phospholipid phosphatase